MELIKTASKNWPIKYIIKDNLDLPYESNLLQLNASKAENHLRWKPVWGFRESVEKTMNWYKEVHIDKISPFMATYKTIEDYQQA